jgi:hypothetical protein
MTARPRSVRWTWAPALGAAALLLSACGGESIGSAVCGNAVDCDAEPQPDAARPGKDASEADAPPVPDATPDVDASDVDASAPDAGDGDASDGSEDAPDGGPLVIGDGVLLPGGDDWDMEPGTIWFVPIVAPADCTVLDAGVIARAAGASIRLALYDDADEQPGNRLATFPDLPLALGKNEIEATPPPPALAAGRRYWIAGLAVGDAAAFYQNHEHSRTLVCYAQANAEGTFPETYGLHDVGCAGVAPSINWYLRAQPSHSEM